MLFRKEAVEQRSRSGMGEVIINQPRIFGVLTIAIMIITFVAISLAIFGNYSRRETVVGYLAPEAGLSPIYAVRGGVITQVLVTEGREISAGQQLFRISADLEGDESPQSIRTQITRIEERILEARTQYETTEALFNGRVAELERTIRTMQADINHLSQTFALARESVAVASSQWDRWRTLRDRGLAPNADVDRVQQALITARLNQQNVEQQISERNNDLNVAEDELSLLPARRELELSQLRSTIITLETSRQDLERAAGYVLVAPVSGRISSLQATVGQTTRPDHPLAVITPIDSQLLAYLLVPTASAGFVNSGQEIHVRIDAFPHQRFGSIEGIARTISSAALTPAELSAPVQIDRPVYVMVVQLSAQHIIAYGTEEPFQSGMTLVADIIIDERPLWRWFLDPVLATRS